MQNRDAFQIAILYPTFALALLVFIVWAVMNFQRFEHLFPNPPSAESLAQDDIALSYPTPASANFRGLCELPVLYFALVPLLLLTKETNQLQVALAWVFVVLRIAQSFIHIRTTKWGASGTAMLFSTIGLAAMWVAFFIDILHAPAPQIG